ncbi:MAG: ABC transporter permease [Wenzhouxiangella sp.]|nr:ABC transporter permease [Wenzhouxiangella sp.]
MREIDSGLLLGLLARELRTRLSNVTTGWFWLIVTPLLLLAVYGLVFGVIFRARVPADLEVPFVAWLAVALWPWLAFSDGALRGAQAIQQHAALIAKVSVPRWLLTASSQTAAFLLQGVGYLVVLLVLGLFGVELDIRSLPYLLLILSGLFVFSLGLALLLSALQVFLRDLEQLLPTLFMLWFFLTPIIYAPEMLPEKAIVLLQLNPMTWWVGEIRAALFYDKWLPDLTFMALFVSALLMLWVGKTVFDRLSPHFEDFL